MDEKDSYLTCIIIIAIAFVIIVGLLIFFSLTKDEFLQDGEIKIPTKTSTTEYTRNTRRTTSDEYYGQAVIKKISKISGSRNVSVDFSNTSDENYYISKMGNHELVLKASDETQWDIEESNSCITYTLKDGNTYVFNADACNQVDKIIINVSENNQTKKYIINNEEKLDISYNGKVVNGTINLDDDLVEFITNIPVEWIASDNKLLNYTDISDTNIQFKVNYKITIQALTKGGQEIDILFNY